ncbi:hypothetical protein D3C87_362500 [compost metagenome]
MKYRSTIGNGSIANINVGAKTFNIILLQLAFVLLLSFVNDVICQTVTSDKKPLKVLIIGNSFSVNASRFLPALAKEGGHELIIGRAEVGGCSIQRHWNFVEAYEANPEDTIGRPYQGKSLKMLLSAESWDIITLQQYSLLSSDFESYRPYARKICDYIKKLQPNAEIVLHQTWAYRSDATSFGKIAGDDRAKNHREMWEKSRAAYHQAAKDLGLRIIPVGDAFWTVASGEKWGYQKDQSYDFENPVYPTLPNQKTSLHAGYRWDKDKALKFDPNHANGAGSYLGSLIWYGFLFNEKLKQINYFPESVSPDFAEYLRETAALILNTN